MSKKKNGWYFRKNATKEFYTHSAASKKELYTIGPGYREPTPQELIDFLRSSDEVMVDDCGLFGVRYSAKDTTQKAVALPGGFYRHEKRDPYEDSPERLVPTEMRSDTVVALPDTFGPVIEDIKSFMTEEAKQIDKELGIQHRKGILFYGPPGTGKTTLIRSVLKDVIPADAIVIFMESLFSNDMLKAIKAHEGDRLKVMVFEEMVTAVESIKMDRLLDFLDGERSLDNTLVIGTTNYPEKLPGNIVDRPGRFDSLYKIGDPSKSQRRLLLNFYLSRACTDDEVRLTDGMSTAAIKELCLIMRRQKKTMEVAATSIRKHRELVKKEFSESKPMGLGFRGNDDVIDDDD